MSELAPLPTLGSRFDEAVRYANAVHAPQRRKGTGIPYVAHLLAVAALVLEHGGDEDQAIAALLHDAPEDQGGRERLADIERRFGGRVAAIVNHCTDTFEDPKPPWRERKERYVEHLDEAPADALLVSLADKVHNARAVLLDYRYDGEPFWGRFNAGRDEVMWYYRALVERFVARVPAGQRRLAEELGRTVAAMDAEIARRATGKRV